jgi:hypothetical protein
VVYSVYKMIYTIYKISIADEDYIGSTRDFKQRIKGHKSTCNNELNPHYLYKIYQHIRANGGWDCCNITPVEEFECETKQQALIREEYWRREYKSLLNTNKAFTTEEELKITTECECGGHYRPPAKNKHFKSKRHQEFISSGSLSTA